MKSALYSKGDGMKQGRKLYLIVLAASLFTFNFLNLFAADMPGSEALSLPEIDQRQKQSPGADLAIDVALEQFWLQANAFAMLVEDVLLKINGEISVLEKLHDERLTSLQNLGYTDRLKQTITQEKWRILQTIKRKEKYFREALGRLQRRKELNSVTVSPSELKDVISELQGIIAEFARVCSIKGVAKKRNVAAASLHSCISYTNYMIKLLKATWDEEDGNRFWYEKLKKMLWGSTFSYQVLPWIIPLLPQLYTFISWQKSSDKTLEELTDHVKHLRSQEIKDVLLRFIKDGVVSAIFGQIGSQYRELQSSAYQKRLKEEEEKVKLARHRIKQSGQKRERFKDIIGYDQAKKDVAMIIEQLKNPFKATRFGGKIMKGVLLEGPRGVGKTMFARAVAGEARVPFFHIKPSELQKQGKMLSDIFNEIQLMAPAIAFIDELDFIGLDRKQHTNTYQSFYLQELLEILDGFDSGNPYKPVVIIAATNHSDKLDDALKRAGRFDLEIHAGNPTEEARRKLFEKHLKYKMKRDLTDVEYDELTGLTTDYSCADIVGAITKHAMMLTESDGRQFIEMDDLRQGILKVRVGVPS